MIAHRLPIYVALEPVDMRYGSERLGALVRERMRAEPRSRALFAFVGKRGHSMKVLTWDGTGRSWFTRNWMLADSSCRGRQGPGSSTWWSVMRSSK